LLAALASRRLGAGRIGAVVVSARPEGLARISATDLARYWGSSSHLMKNGQSFGIFVLIWDLGGIDDTQT
jgi:hypothetical protein